MDFVGSFGAAFPTFYRLTGPFKVAKAKGIVETELWDTIKRRGVVGNIFMGVIPMVSKILKIVLPSGLGRLIQVFRYFMPTSIWGHISLS